MRYLGTLCIAASLVALPAGDDTMPGTENSHIPVLNDGVIALVPYAHDHCVPLQQLGSVDNQRSERIKDLFAIAGRTPLGQSLVQTGMENNVTVCIINPEENGFSNGLLDAAFYMAENTMVFNEKHSMGCLVSLNYQELHHAEQYFRGYISLSNLVIEDEIAYQIELELDAHAIQVTASSQLTDPLYASVPYQDAFNCLSQFAETRGDLKVAAGLMEVIQTHHPEWTESGQAARQIYQLLIDEGELASDYTWAISMSDILRDDEEPPPVRNRTIPDGHFDDLGKIHYEADYRALPLAPVAFNR